ncbi:LETM1 domain-containing protein mdm28 [Yarrowia lipolytica]|nr:LETM1 domain-containing protein mdm28 [Yarrowia lipolytica]
MLRRISSDSVKINRYLGLVTKQQLARATVVATTHTIATRRFHTRPVVYQTKDADAKETKANLEKNTKATSAEQKSDVKAAAAAAAPADGAVAKKEEKTPKTWKETIKEAARHYWDGTKLLGFEIKVSSKLAMKLAAGYELTRREKRQLKRTTQDIVRVVPFAMFLIIPFAELLLPVALKLFPGLLPSTYMSSNDIEKRARSLRKTRGSVSSFLKDTVNESGLTAPTSITPEQRQQFVEFFDKVRAHGEKPSRELLISVAQMFKDDLVLDNLSRPQLVAMAKYMNLQHFGTNLMLRYSIRYKMRQIKIDDRAIYAEGVDSLSLTELQIACASRGIKTHALSKARLAEDLNNWLELRLRQKVPSTLLILSSAFTYGEADDLNSHYDALEAVLSAIPEELFHEADLEYAHATDQATNKQRLEVVREQQELIQEENQQEEESGHIIQVKDDLNLDEEEAKKEEARGEAQRAETERAKEFFEMSPPDVKEAAKKTDSKA